MTCGPEIYIFPLKKIEVCNERRHFCWKINLTCLATRSRSRPVFSVFLSLRKNPKGTGTGGMQVLLL